MLSEGDQKVNIEEKELMSCAGNYFLEIEGTSTLYFPVLQLEN